MLSLLTLIAEICVWNYHSSILAMNVLSRTCKRINGVMAVRMRRYAQIYKKYSEKLCVAACYRMINPRGIDYSGECMRKVIVHDPGAIEIIWLPSIHDLFDNIIRDDYLSYPAFKDITIVASTYIPIKYATLYYFRSGTIIRMADVKVTYQKFTHIHIYKLCLPTLYNPIHLYDGSILLSDFGITLSGDISDAPTMFKVSEIQNLISYLIVKFYTVPTDHLRFFWRTISNNFDDVFTQPATRITLQN